MLDKIVRFFGEKKFDPVIVDDGGAVGDAAVSGVTDYIDKLDPNAFGGTNLWGVIKNVINVAMAVLGAVCVVMLIFAGYNYTTSAGDSGKVTKAKNTMLYAIIGLIIALLSLAIVNFVLDNIF